MPRATRQLWTQRELQRSLGGRGERPHSKAAPTAGLAEQPAGQAISDQFAMPEWLWSFRFLA
jgi:hypothetical protein